MLDFINRFKDNYKIDPIKYKSDHITIIKMYETDQSNMSYETRTQQSKKVIKERKLNPKYLVVPNDNQGQFKITNFIKTSNLYIDNHLKTFLKLQNNNSEYIVLTKEHKPADIEDTVFNIAYYDNYLQHKKYRGHVNTKLGKIISHKFSKNKKGNTTTNAILANIGYIIKNDEDSYLELSKNDYGFIRNFVYKLIREGNYKLKVTESLPLYKEDVKKIIEIGKGLLNLTNNKTMIKKSTKDHLEQTRNTIEGAWQLYFEKYLKLFFLKYKSFHTNIVFKKMAGFSKDSIPDFLAVDLYDNVDIIEIKTHNTPLIRKDKNRDAIYPSSDLNKAVFQLSKYLDLSSNLIKVDKISDSYTRSLITQKNIYKPRGVLIISSKKHIGANAIKDEETLRIQKEIKRLKTFYSNVEIILFDELIESLELYLTQIELS